MAKKLKDVIRTNPEPAKGKFGVDPMDPWSTKANIAEDGSLNQYLLSRGINPKFVSGDTKISHAKSSAFLKWKQNHQFESVESLDEDALLDKFLMSRGINPKYATKDMKISYAKSGQFIKWKHDHMFEEVQLEEVDKADTLTFDIPLMIRMLELAREDVKDDMELHRITERLISIRNKGTLTMDDYEFIAGIKKLKEEIEALAEGKMKSAEIDKAETQRLNKMTTLQKFRADSAARTKKHDAIEKNSGGMTSAIDRLQAHMNKEEVVQEGQMKRMATDREEDELEKKASKYDFTKTKSGKPVPKQTKPFRMGNEPIGKMNKEEVEELDEAPVVIKTNKEIGAKVTSIGPGGKETVIKTDSAYAKYRKMGSSSSNARARAAGEKNPQVFGPVPAKAFARGVLKDLKKVNVKEEVELHEDKMLPPVHKKVISKAGNHIGTVYKYDKPNVFGHTYGASYHPHGGRGGASGVEWTHHDNPETAEKTIHRQHGLYKAAATKAVQKAEKHKTSIPEETSVKEHIVKSGAGYKLLSTKTGKSLGTASSKVGIEKREREVQYFKHKNEDTLDPLAATQSPNDCGTSPNDVSPKKQGLSKSARMIKALYKHHNMKEDMTDWEKEDKSVQTYGKKPKVMEPDEKKNLGEKKPDARIVMSGGTTLTGEKRDTVEIDPAMKSRPGPDTFGPSGKKASQQ